MDNNNNNMPTWMQILNTIQVFAVWIMTAHQNNQHIQHAFDRDKLDADARNIRANMSQQYGETTERIRSTRRDLTISKSTIVGIGAVGAAILIRGGNKAIQKLKNEQNTTINQLKTELKTDINELATRTDANLNQTQENLNKLANDLATQLAQTQENFNKVTSELETKLNTTTNAAGGTGTASGTGGNVHIGSEIFSQLYDANQIQFDSRVERSIAPKLGEVESRLQARIDSMNSNINAMNSNMNSRIDSLLRPSRTGSTSSPISNRPSQGGIRHVEPLSLTYNEKNSAQYQGFIPQNESLVAPLSLTAPGVLQNTDELVQQQQLLAKQMENLRKVQAEVERTRTIQEELNARLAFTPPESDSAIKMNPLPKDDPGDDNGGNPGLGAGTSQVEVNYLFISNNNFNLFPNSINLINTDKLINFNGFSSSKLIKPIVAQSSVSKPVAINKLNNHLHYLISKNTINYNLNDNLDNSCINTEHPVDITISNKSSTHPELINDIKLFNIITNDGSTVYNTSSIGDSTFGHRLNANQDIQPNRIINLNKHLFKNDNLESFSIADSDINQSVVENNNIIELCNIRQILHNKWLNSRLTSYPLIKDDFNQSLIEDIVDIKLTDDIIPILQTHDLTKTFIITKNLNINQYINIKKTNNTLCLNNSSLYIEPSFVSHALYLDFLDLVYCELFFNQQLINLNMSCFIYGSIFVPSLFILNSLGYLVLFSIFTTTFTLFNSGLDIILKTFLNKTNYSFIKNILNTSYSIVFNSIFFYIILLNISNVSVISNLILLKGTTLYGSKMLKDLHKSNNQYFKENIVINKALFINPYIYKNKMEL